MRPFLRRNSLFDSESERKMKTVKGKFAKAMIFTGNVEDYALAQVQMICDNEAADGSVIRVMPDIHPGKIGPVGLTMIVKDSVMPVSLRVTHIKSLIVIIESGKAG